MPILRGVEEPIRRQVDLQTASIELSVTFAPGQSEYAEYVLSRAATYLEHVEEYLSSPCPRKESVAIHIVEGGGSNKGDYIEIDFGGVDNPALLFHELSHYWYGYYLSGYDQGWLIEGLMSFLPIAMAESGLLPISQTEYRMIFAAWSFERTDFPVDYPVYNAFTEDNSEEMRSLAYPKIFKIQYLIHRELGRENYRRLPRRLLDEV